MILLIIAFVSLILVIVFACHNRARGFYVSVLGLTLFSCGAVIYDGYIEEDLFVKSTFSTPTALDVYRGKTTLEITYRDSVAIDSVVVYKLKEERK